MPQITDPQAAPGSSAATEAKHWSLYLAGFLGGIILAIGDLATNDTSATVLKLQAVLHKYVSGDIQNGGLAGLLFVGGLGAVFCWVWPVLSRGEAFIRGFSVFAILTVGTPYKGDDQQQQLRVKPPLSTPAGTTGLLQFNLIANAHAGDQHPSEGQNMASDEAPIAIVTVDRSISSCRPNYWGPFGLGSFFNNSLKFCDTDHDLPAGTKVKILDCWDTGLRNYRYTNISYVWENTQKTGWAMSGKGPKYWEKIVPEKSSLSRLPKNCR